MPMSIRKYNFAVSFAGENRLEAKKLVDLLTNRGAIVFYDEHKGHDHLSEDLYQKFNNIYKNCSDYVIVFASKEYLCDAEGKQNEWTRHELKAAQARAISEDSGYIIPILLDETEIPGINKTCGYLDWRELSPEQIADDLVKKLFNLSDNIGSPIKGSKPIERFLVGIKSYGKEDSDDFVRMEYNQRQVLTLKKSVEDNFITLFYGENGLGKTSLLRAGLVPSLNAKNSRWQCIYTSPDSLHNKLFNISDFKPNYSDLKNDESLDSVITCILAEDKSNSKFLIIIDQFEHYDLNRADERNKTYLKELFNELYSARDGNQYKNRVSIIIVCRDSSPNHMNFLMEEFENRKRFSTCVISCFDAQSARIELGLVLSICSEEEELFEEFFEELTQVSNSYKRLKTSNLVHPFYFQVFGECWKYLSNGSKMTRDKLNSLTQDSEEKISTQLIINTCIDSIVKSGYQRIEELFTLYELISFNSQEKRSKLDLSVILPSLRIQINELSKDDLNTSIKIWHRNLVDNVRSWSAALGIHLKNQMDDNSLEKAVEKILEENIIALQIIELLDGDNTYIQEFLKFKHDPHDPYQSIEVILLLSLYSRCNGKFYEYRQLFKKSLSPSLISEFNDVVRDLRRKIST